MKYYVLADVHGFYDLMRKTLEDVGYFKDENPKKLVICGDLFDRGQGARELQDFISEQIAGDEVILVRGNHEDLFLQLIDADGGLPLYHHRSNGTFNTALQLTLTDAETATRDLSKFCAAARATEFYKTIIPSMVNYFETKRYVFVHGWIPVITSRYITASAYAYNPNWRNASESEWEAARWSNGMELSTDVVERGKTIICGHWHASYGHAKLEGRGSEFGEDADFSPYYGRGIIALDACTAFSHKMNCLVLED